MIDSLVGAAIVGAGADLVGGFINSIGAHNSNKTQLKIAREQMAWNESMWNKQNEYNTPAAQIERMKAAGLNPALMYTQGNVGNAGEVRGYSQPSVQNELAGIGAGISDAGSAMMRLELLKQQRAQTKLLEAKAVKEINSTMTPENYLKSFIAKYNNTVRSSNLMEAKEQYQDLVNLWASESFAYRNQTQKAELNKVITETSAIATRIALETLRTHAQIRLSKAQTAQVQAATRYLNLKYDCLEKLAPEQYNELVAKIALLSSQGKLADVNANAVERGINLKEDQFEFEKYLKSVEEGRKWFDTMTPW